MNTLRELREVRRKLRDVRWNGHLVRRAAGEHRACAHANPAERYQYLLPHTNAATLTMAGQIGRRHELRGVGYESEHVMLRHPAHALPMKVVTIEMLIDVERDVAVLDLFKHVPFEEIADWTRSETMVIQPAREDSESELRGVRLEALDITDAEPIGLVDQEASEIPLQYFDALFQSRIAVRQHGLVEIHVSPIVLGLLAREAIGIVAQGLVADLVQHP